MERAARAPHGLGRSLTLPGPKGFEAAPTAGQQVAFEPNGKMPLAYRPSFVLSSIKGMGRSLNQIEVAEG